VNPHRIVNIGGKPHRLAVFRVESRDERGRPETLVNIPDDRTAELSHDPRDNHFIVAWVSVDGFRDEPSLADWRAT